MKNSNTTIATCTYRVLTVIAFAVALFVVLPVGQITGIETVSAQYGYDYGSDGYSLGSVTSGCCDSYSYSGGYSDFGYSYSDYDYGSDGYSLGSVTSGCCDAYSYGDYSDLYATPVTYDYDYGSDGYSLGSVTSGCCDAYSYGDYSDLYATPVTYDYDYGSDGYSLGSVTSGCCDAYTFNSQDTPYNPDYPDVIPDAPYFPEVIDYINPYDDGPGYVPTYGYDNYILPYSYDGGSYAYSYNSTPYSYSSYNSYNNTPYTYNNPPNPPRSEPRPVCTLDITPNSIDEDENATIRWTTRNATTVTLSDGIGSVSRNGTRTISPNTDKTYVLVATGPGGTVSCSDHITVDDEDDNDNDRNVRCDAFTVSDRTVEKGDKVTLNWRTTGARDVKIDQGVGDVSDDGSERVEIRRDTTFKLTATNGSDRDTCTVDVEIEDEDEDDDEDAPRCALTISDTKIAKGGSVKLSWNNLRTDRLILKDNHGKEIADSREDRDVDEDKDSVTLKPSRSTEYILTVYNGNEKRTCTVGVTIGDITVTSVRSQDTITLSQVPYTGFEAGPVLTFIFYTALGLWGVAIAYVLVFKQKVAVVATSALASHAVPAVAHMVATAGVSATPTIPFNLPEVSAPEVMAVDEDVHDVIKTLEQHAHTAYALISSDALRFIASQNGTYDEQVETLNRVIALAKTRYPKEGDWVVINKERVITLLA